MVNIEGRGATQIISQPNLSLSSSCSPSNPLSPSLPSFVPSSLSPSLPLPLFTFLPTQVNTNHPIIKEARKCGHTIFVISTIFQAEHCNIEVSFSEKVDDSASAGVQPTSAVGVSEGGSIADSSTSVKGMNIWALWSS